MTFSRFPRERFYFQQSVVRAYRFLSHSYRRQHARKKDSGHSARGISEIRFLPALRYTSEIAALLLEIIWRWPWRECRKSRDSGI